MAVRGQTNLIKTILATLRNLQKECAAETTQDGRIRKGSRGGCSCVAKAQTPNPPNPKLVKGLLNKRRSK
eukprot:4392479-Amphidinium_carterae.1